MLSLKKYFEIRRAVEENKVEGVAVFSVSGPSETDNYLPVLQLANHGYIDRLLDGVNYRAVVDLGFYADHRLAVPEYNIVIYTNGERCTVLKIMPQRRLQILDCASIDGLISIVRRRMAVGRFIFDRLHSRPLLDILKAEQERVKSYKLFFYPSGVTVIIIFTNDELLRYYSLDICY